MRNTFLVARSVWLVSNSEEPPKPIGNWNLNKVSFNLNTLELGMIK